MDLFFRVSEVARELGATSNTIRRLIEAGLVKGQATAGGHLRVPSSELERLRRDGIPTAPRPLPPGPEEAEGDDAEIRPAPRAREKPSSIEVAESSPPVVRAAESVRILEHAVSAGTLQQRLEEQEDWWRDRKKRESEEREAEEALRRGQEAARERQSWRERWQGFALKRIPVAAPPDLVRGIYQRVGELLDTLQPFSTDELTGALVDAEIQKEMRPWERRAARDAAVKAAAERLPAGARSRTSLTIWQTRAIQAAREAVGQLPDSADQCEISAAVQHAVEPITAEFVAHELRNDVIGWASLRASVLGLTQSEAETAGRAIAQAVSSLPLAASRSEMEGAAEEALAPYRRAIAQRKAEAEDRATRKSLMSVAEIKLWDVPTKEKDAAVAAVVEAFATVPAGTPQDKLAETCDRALRPYLAANAQGKRKEDLITRALSKVFTWLLEHQAEIDLEGKSLTTVDGELKADLEKVLEEELGGNESAEQAAKLVRRWLREEFRL